MELPQEDLAAIRRRLVRAQGQLGGIIKMIDENRECTDVLNQLSAANSAIARAGFALIASGIAACGTGESGVADRQKLEKAFLSLS